ncbi:D-glycero-beta-D-manno-heptose-7-phosphate kinase [bacterium]|nr:D-glycero-beta-D-manno-heptose-7-phosphate kinase [bacterium]
MKNSSVAVIGDIMLDRYYWGLVERISPEAPVPVVKVGKTDVRPGGAANVAWNLVSLGVECSLVGVLSSGPRGKELQNLIKELGVKTDCLVEDNSRVTTEKIRIVAHNQQVVRADFESEGDIEGKILDKLIAIVEKVLEDVGAVVISDYGKGVVTEKLMETIRRLCVERSIPLLVDPKEKRFSLYHGSYIVTPNLNEAGGFYNRRIRSEEDLVDVGQSLLEDLEANAVLVTRGEEGMTLFSKGQEPCHFPTMASGVYDVTGAGDTVISVLAAAIAAKAGLKESIELANMAAGLVVRELGTAAVTVKELVSSFVS